MKEKIETILNNEEIETTTEKVDLIAKEIAKLTVPKDKYNKMSERVQTLESEKEEIQDELDEIKNKSLTDDQKQNKELEKTQKELNRLRLEINEGKAKEIFRNANIPDEKIDDLVAKVVSDDETKTIDLANSFAEVLSVKIESTKKETENDFLINTPKPNTKETGNSPKQITKEDFMNMSYGEKKELYSKNHELFEQLNSELEK